MDTETKAHAYKTSRYCPNCPGPQPTAVGYHPMARTVYAHCFGCKVTRALPRVSLARGISTPQFPQIFYRPQMLT